MSLTVSSAPADSCRRLARRYPEGRVRRDGGQTWLCLSRAGGHARDRHDRPVRPHFPLDSKARPDPRGGPLLAGSAGFSPPSLAGEWSLDAVLAAETTESTPCDSQRLACILVAGVYAGGPFDPLPGYFLHLFPLQMPGLRFNCFRQRPCRFRAGKKNRLRFSEPDPFRNPQPAKKNRRDVIPTV